MALKLPENSDGWWLGAVVADLLRQLDYWTVAPVAAGHFLSAAIALWDATLSPRFKRCVYRDGNCWNFGKLRYSLAWPLSDMLIHECIESNYPQGTIFIAPPGQHILLSDLLEAKLPKYRFSVRSIDEFISWRTFCAEMDADLSPLVVKRALMLAYQRYAATCSPEEPSLQFNDFLPPRG